MSNKGSGDEREQEIPNTGLGNEGEQNIQIELGNVEESGDIETGVTIGRRTEDIIYDSPVDLPRYSSTRTGSVDMGIVNMQSLMQGIIKMKDDNKKISDESKKEMQERDEKNKKEMQERDNKMSDKIEKMNNNFIKLSDENTNKLAKKIEGLQLGLETLKIDLQSTNVRVDQNYKDIKCIQANVISKNARR